MNIDNPLGFQTREVEEVEHEGQPARSVRGSRVYTTDVADLWDAVTNPERIPRWFLPVSGDLRLGGKFQLEGNAGGTITHCEPPTHLGVTWEFGGSVGWVHVRLEEHEKGTKLVLDHITPQEEAAEQHWAQFGAGATGVGWDLGLVGLMLHLESGGEQVDAAGFMTWMTGDEGKAYVRRCAEHWGTAHAASAKSAEDAEAARAMAERTAKFFSGEA